MPAAVPVELHPDALPLAFLLGSWVGEGVVGYPTMPEALRFTQQLTVRAAGPAVLSWSSSTAHADTGRPLAGETGWLRARPGREVEMLLAHPTGIVEILYGSVAGTQLELTNEVMARTASAKEVTASTRLYGLVEGELMYAVDLAMMGEPLQPHFSARLHRARPSDPGVGGPDGGFSPGPAPTPTPGRSTP